MSWRSHKRRRAGPPLDRIEQLEGRALLSIMASAFSQNVLKSGPATIDLAQEVQDSDPNATVAYDLVSTTTTDGGAVSVNASSGLVSFTPAANSPAQDSFQYFATDSDSDTSSTESVTLNVSSVAASPVAVSEVEGQSTIDLAILNVPGAVLDIASKPSYTFSSVQLEGILDGSVSLSDAKDGSLSYTPPSPTFTGGVTIYYQVSDGTGSSASTVQLNIGPIAADPVVWGTLASTSATVPSTIVPSLLDRIHDVSAHPTYTFSNAILPAGDGMVTNLDPATGSFTYTAPVNTFTGTVPVEYTVSDGTNSTTGDVSIEVAPLVTEPVAVTELDHQTSVALTILNLAGAVQDAATNPAYTFSDLRIVDGGGSVPASGFDDASMGTFTYTLPSSASAHPVHIAYAVTDGTNSASGVVTIELVGIVADSASSSVLENTPSTLASLVGRIVDVESKPTFTFAAPSVPAGDGTVQFTDTSMGVLSYTPPNPNFTGTFPIQYTVSDGTNSTIGVLNLTVAPLVTTELLAPAALETQSTTVPSLVASGNVQDVASQPSYTFSDLIVAPGDGTAHFTSTTTGALTYTPPSITFFGLAQLTYTVTDGASNSATGSVLVNVEQTIQPKDDGPIQAVAGKPLTIAAVDLLSNDSPAPDGLRTKVGSVDNAENGTVVLDANGSVTFTPVAKGPASFTYTDNDADNDASTVATVTLNVKLGPVITWPTPAAIVYGTRLSGVQLDAMANVPGTFNYGPQIGTLLDAGNGQTLVVTFTPADSVDYADTTDKVLINVAQATTVLTWPSPGTIRYDTPLGSAQLDATANVPGTFAYFPGAGTVLPAGNEQTLAVVFTPFDAVDYTEGEATTIINVQPDPPPGLTVHTHTFSGRVNRKIGGVIAQLHTTSSKLKASSYSALVNWDDGDVQAGKLAKSGSHGFTVTATHKYRVAGTYQASVTIADRFGDSVTQYFMVSVE